MHVIENIDNHVRYKKIIADSNDPEEPLFPPLFCYVEVINYLMRSS